MYPRLTHIALHVHDLEACVRFYAHYCGMKETRSRPKKHSRIVWMAEPGRETDMIFVLLPAGPGHQQSEQDFSHLGFAVESRERVDEIAELGRAGGCLLWEPVQEPWPVGYYCGLRDPDGNYVEFSYGQPLGPGAEAPAE